MLKLEVWGNTVDETLIVASHIGDVQAMGYGVHVLFSCMSFLADRRRDTHCIPREMGILLYRNPSSNSSMIEIDNG